MGEPQIICCTMGMKSEEDSKLVLELYDQVRRDSNVAYIFEQSYRSRYPYHFSFTGPIEDIVWIVQMLTSQGVDWGMLYFEYKPEKEVV